MNIIIKNALEEYCKSQNIDGKLDQSKKFELFATHLAISSLAENSASTVHAVVGDDGQYAVDAIGIVVNGNLIANEDEIDNYIEINKYLDVDFIFIQAKTSETFEVSVLGELGAFAHDFINNPDGSTDNAETASIRSMKNVIYKNSKYFRNRNPNVIIYYITTGQKPSITGVFEKKINLIRKQFESSGTTARCDVALVGTRELQELKRLLENSIEREFDFSRKIPLPKTQGVDQAYLGVIPANIYLELLEGSHGNMLSSIFYDNVRDWQGENSVNSGIGDTIKDQNSRSRFVFMNNGITIISKEIRVTGDKVLLKDYQVVNGCQTSNVLWRNKDFLDGSILIPLRVIATTQEDVIRDIIRATNSQTEIPAAQLLAATDFQKQLEQHFQAQHDMPLYYERRSKQYANTSIDRTRTLTPISLMKAYASTVLKEPHRTNRDFKSVVDQAGTTIFGSKHKVELYYMAALAQYWVDTFLRRGVVDKYLTSARFQILLAFTLLNQAFDMPAAESNKAGKWAKHLIDKIKTDHSAQISFQPAIDLVASLITDKKNVRDEVRARGFTDLVIKQANMRTSKNAKP